MAVQLWPPLVVFQTPAVAKNRTLGSLGDQIERLGANGARRRIVGHARGLPKDPACSNPARRASTAAPTATSAARRRPVRHWSFAGDAIIEGHFFRAVDQVGILRVGRGFAVLLDVHRMPIVEGDFAIHAAAVHAGRAGILLAAAEAVGESVIGGHVIHRRGGLGVPVAPRFAAIGRDHPALVAHQQNDVRSSWD